METTEYSVAGSMKIDNRKLTRASHLFHAVQRASLKAESIRVIDMRTYPIFTQILHAPGTTIRVDYVGASLDNLDRAIVSFYSDDSEKKIQAKGLLEELIGFNLEENVGIGGC